MSGRLDGKVAVITGGASGMGAATVRKFVAEGARVVIADVQEDKGRQLAEDIGPEAVFAFADVCREVDVQGMIEAAVNEFGGLDCLFNNAGFGGVTGDIEATDMGEPYERTVGAMLTGVVLGMKHAVPHLKARGGGAIISTASVAGIKGGIGAPRLFGGEGGGGQPQPFGGHGTGAVQHSRQRHLPRRHRHADLRGPARAIRRQ